MSRISEFKCGKMIIRHSDKMKTVTDLSTGKTDLIKNGKVINSWPNMRITAFEKLQRDLAEATIKMSSIL